jgi:hypothetical protein
VCLPLLLVCSSLAAVLNARYRAGDEPMPVAIGAGLDTRQSSADQRTPPPTTCASQEQVKSGASSLATPEPEAAECQGDAGIELSSDRKDS